MSDGKFNIPLSGQRRPGELQASSGAGQDLNGLTDSADTLGMGSAPALVAGQYVVAESVDMAALPTAPPPELNDLAETFDTRAATVADIDRMVELDIVAFRRVYSGQGRGERELRRELAAMFQERFRILGGALMPVVTRRTSQGGEEVIGFTHLMRTDNDPKDFVSWEATTANGWIGDKHKPDGKHMYVVTLTMSPEVAGEDAQLLLVARARGIMVEEDCDLIYSESRMPGLKKWVEHWCADNDRAFNELDEATVDMLANIYFKLERYDSRVDGMLPRDPMLAFCVLIGNMPLYLKAKAYIDEQSLNYGAVCVIPNPLAPDERTPEARTQTSQLYMSASHSLDLAMALVFGA